MSTCEASVPTTRQPQAFSSSFPLQRTDMQVMAVRFGGIGVFLDKINSVSLTEPSIPK